MVIGQPNQSLKTNSGEESYVAWDLNYGSDVLYQPWGNNYTEE